MAVTLCVPPRAGELCAPIRFLLRGDSTVVELTSRHRVTEIGWDETEHAVAEGAQATPRSRHLGSLTRDGETVDVYGTYLGVVADEN